MKIETKYNLGDVVFLITNPDQKERMITAIKMNPGNIVYSLSLGMDESNHYEMEISSTKDVLKAAGV